jgi:hypothetical protein
MTVRNALLALVAACGTPPAGGGPCDALRSDYDREIAQVSSCTTAAQCGQPIAGTGCGCTRDLVARNEADLGAVVTYQEQAPALDCTLGATSDCDCPAALGFDCIDGTCAYNLVERYPYLPVCPQPGGPYMLRALRLEGSDLLATVSYAGGCASHDFGLCWNSQAFEPTDPVTATLALYHADGGDTCGMGMVQELTLSVAPLAQAFADAYGSSHGTVRLSLDGQTVDWTF